MFLIDTLLGAEENFLKRRLSAAVLTELLDATLQQIRGTLQQNLEKPPIGENALVPPAQSSDQELVAMASRRDLGSRRFRLVLANLRTLSAIQLSQRNCREIQKPQARGRDCPAHRAQCSQRRLEVPVGALHRSTVNTLLTATKDHTRRKQRPDEAATAL